MSVNKMYTIHNVANVLFNNYLQEICAGVTKMGTCAQEKDPEQSFV
jgi:hypothetical protein